MKIARYSSNNSEEIQQLFYDVFSASEGPEQGLSVSTLAHDLMTTTDPADFCGYTAVAEGVIIGAIFFSKLTFDNQVNALILSPVAIHTQYQSKGVGEKLIKFGIEDVTANGVELLFTYGSPDYYAKTGFRPISEKIAKAPLTLSMPFGWLAQSLVNEELEPIPGNSRCVEALNKQEIW